MLLQLLYLMVLDNLDLGFFEGLTDKDLQNGLHFEFVVEELIIQVLHLDLFVISLVVGNEDWTGWPIDVVVWLELSLIDHVVIVAQFIPRVLVLQIHQLLSLLLFFHHLLSSLIVFLPFVQTFQTLPFHHLFLFLFLDECWVWLHIHRDH